MTNKSKHFKDSEIRGILPDGSIYLKTGVRRKKFNDHIDEDNMTQINHELIDSERLTKVLTKLFGDKDDPSEE